MQEEKKSIACGLVGFILTLVFGFIPMNAYVASIGCITGFILGIIAANTDQGKGFGITAIVLGALGVIGGCYLIANGVA